MTAELAHDWYPRPLPGNVVLGDRCWLHSAHALVHCASVRDVALAIGDDSGVYHGTHFDLGQHASVVITSHQHTFTERGSDIRSQPIEFAPVVIERDVWIGANATILPGVRMGEGSVAGAGAVVTRDVAPGAVVLGVPARVSRVR